MVRLKAKCKVVLFNLILFGFCILLVFLVHQIKLGFREGFTSSNPVIPVTRNEEEAFKDLLIDTRSVNESTIVSSIEAAVRNVPFSEAIRYLNSSKARVQCPQYPSLYELKFSNYYWQTLSTSNGTFQLFGAYYDNRTGKPYVRILGMLDRIEPTIKTFCHLWYNNKVDASIVPVEKYHFLWRKQWGNHRQGVYQPYLISCLIPESIVPYSVSLSEQKCNSSTTNVRVFNNQPEGGSGGRKDFAVCVKGLDFLYEDLSVRLVEWIELLGILGADKIFFYELHVHPNISKVLKHYEQLGKVDVTPITLPGGQPNIPGFQHLYLGKKVVNKRQNEIIPYNDCLYRNIHRYSYIVLLDIDEVIIPNTLTDFTWRHLMNRILPKSLAIKNKTFSSYNVRNVYFFDDFQHEHNWTQEIPHFMYTLQHVERAKNYTLPGKYVKCFHDTQRVIGVHNHLPFECFPKGGCRTFSVETSEAQLQHYRADCVRELKKSCDVYKENRVQDTTIWKYKETLIERTRKTLEFLGFFGGSKRGSRYLFS